MLLHKGGSNRQTLIKEHRFILLVLQQHFEFNISQITLVEVIQSHTPKFSLKNYCPCWDLNPGPPRYQADMLPTELSWLGSGH